MDIPENYYAVLGVPIDADSETLKRAYRQLARRYHPDLAGPDGAVQMKRINRAYAVLSDPEKRMNYDAVIGGVLDYRKGGLVHPRRKPHRVDVSDDLEFSGLSIFSTKGPFTAGFALPSALGVVSALSSVKTEQGTTVAAGTLDGKGLIWHRLKDNGQNVETAISIAFAAHPDFTVESLRELRFSANAGLLAGWGRLGLHVWDSASGALQWSYPLFERAVSAHYSLDIALQEDAAGKGESIVALPLLVDDARSPRAWGVRGTDVVSHSLAQPAEQLSAPIVCPEDDINNRQFWAIRLRALARDAHSLLTLSCAHVPEEPEEAAVVRRWDLSSRARFGGKVKPRITTSLLAGRCADCSPPYATTPDTHNLAFVYAEKHIRLYDTVNGTYADLPGGTMGGSSRLAISPDAQYLAIAREDSEINEGVVDLWSIPEGQLVQKFYHPWQISALHFGEHQLFVALTDGTIQLWK